MKIMQINTVYAEKSTGRTCKEVENALLARGHDSITAYGHGTHPKSKTTYRIGSWVEYYFHNIASRISGMEGYFSYFATRRLIWKIDAFKPDVIHLRNLHGHYLNLPLLFRYLAEHRYPIVQNLHDCWVYTGKCPHYAIIGCYKWKQECGKCPRLKAYPQSLFFDRTKKLRRDKEKWYSALSDLTVVGVSDWCVEEAKESFLAKAKKLTRIYNWINQEVFHPYDDGVASIGDRYGIPKDKFVILGVSASWSKGTPRYEDFMRLAHMLEDDETLVLVGNASEPIEETSILHIPFVENTTELARLYSRADVYVHCSVEDTFGKVIAEALACGTPAIVYGITGCAEIVSDGCGFVVEPRDVDAVRASIDIIKERDKESYTTKCVARVDSCFNYQTNAQTLIELYEDIYQNSRACK